jgi:hypothetical protein
MIRVASDEGVSKKEVAAFWRVTYPIHCKLMNATISPRQCRLNQAQARKAKKGGEAAAPADNISLDRAFFCGRCKHSKVKVNPQKVYIPGNLPEGTPADV